MEAGDSRSQACSSRASYHWAYRDQRVTLVTIGSALCPKPRRWSWFGGCPRVEARRVSPTIDENSIYMYTLKYKWREGKSGGWVRNWLQSRL